MSILFVDVVGSTRLGEQMHPEEVRKLLGDFLRGLADEVVAEGGRIERVLGDALMATFGAVQAREDDPARAVRAARRILGRVATWNSERQPSEPMNVRIGVNTGEAAVSGLARDELGLAGDAVNVAARLEQAAAPGTILIGERTARAVSRFYRLVPLDPLELKGKTERVQAFRVESERAEDGERATQAPLVGRERELALLRSALDRAEKERAPRSVVIWGEPGIGKSRLAREFLTSTRRRAKTAFGRCLPEASALPFWPLRQMLGAQAGIEERDSRDEIAEKLSRFVAETVGSTGTFSEQRIVEGLAITFGLHPSGSQLATADPREVQRALQDSWIFLFGSLASHRPLLVLIEDLQWADPSLLDLLERAMRETRGSVLFLVTTRPDLQEKRPTWARRRRATSSITLTPLTPTETEALLDTVTGDVAFPSELKKALLDKSEGNPFYLEEILTHMLETGALSRDAEGWRVAERALEEIPDSVHAVLLARIDLLYEPEKKVLQEAAVIGRRFSHEAIEYLHEGDAAANLLNGLIARDLLTRSGSSDYRFRHVLIRDVAYQTLPRKSRAQAHARIAEFIESRTGQRAEEAHGLLSHHYYQASGYAADDVYRRSARRYSLLAGNSALARFAIEEAEAFVVRALERSKTNAEEIEALETLGDVYHQSMQGERAWDAYRQAIDKARAVGEGASASFSRIAAKAAIVPTRWIGTMKETPPRDEIVGIIDEGVEAEAGEDPAVRSQLLAARAFLQGMGYEPASAEGETAARKAVKLAEAVGDPNLVSCAMDALGTWSWPSGRFREINAINEQRLGLIGHLSDVREICDIYLCAGRDRSFIGDYRAAIEHLTACIERARGIDLGQYLHGLVWRVYPRFMGGDWDGALEDQAEIERLVSLDEQRMPPSYTMRAYGAASLCRLLRGENEEAEKYLFVVKRFADETASAGLTFAGPLAVPARALARSGRAEEAMQWLRLERWVYRGTHLEAACDVIAQLGDWERAREIVTMAREEAQHGSLLALTCFADRLEGQIAAASGDAMAAARLLANAAEGFAALHAPWEEAYSNLLLSDPLFGLGEREDGVARLKSSLETFERLRSVDEIVAARAKLSGLSAPPA